LILFLVAFGKKRKGMSQEPRPVSVIVCAHDEEENLKELVPLLLQQNHPQFEVIVVEDRCNDGTFDYLLQATKEHELLKMVRVVNKPDHINGKKFGLTLGIKAAKYDWVLFTDADCRPASKNWIKLMTEKYNTDTKLVLGFSPYFKSPGLLNAFIRFESFLVGIQFIGLALLGKPYMGVGRNLAYHKSLFLENKGFNAHLGVIGGDDDLFVNQHATKKNTIAQMGTESLTLSMPKTTWKDFYYQKLRHLSVGNRYKFLDRLILGLFALTWLLTWFLVVPTAIFSPLAFWFLGIFLLRWILLSALFHIATRQMGDAFEAWKVPFLDFIYAFYYLVAGVAAMTAKRIQWKRN
jgi:cellulose synthase/poly-beta-1,6-N-acetylglucosamine synthase-like glycosyltransferase